ncbi:MAG: hypothetical protein AAFU03_13360, partial [Bacteroidota bacterium]
LDHDVITTVISNTANTGGEVYRLNDQIGQLLLDSNAFSQPVRTIVQLSEQELDRFVGTYLFSEDTEVKIIRREDQLWRIFKGSEPVRLYPISPTEVAWRLFDQQLQLILDESEQVQKVRVVTYGQEAFIEKIK